MFRTVCVYTKYLFLLFCRYVALKGPKFAYYESKDVSRKMYSDQNLVTILARMAILPRRSVLCIACHIASSETATDIW